MIDIQCTLFQILSEKHQLDKGVQVEKIKKVEKGFEAGVLFDYKNSKGTLYYGSTFT